MRDTEAPGSFYFHDYETFGVVPRRDRPVQFAGLRTDAELEEIGEPLNILCRPAPDTLPEPESVLVTGLLPQQALRDGLPECEFAARIEAELARDGTVGLGYNSLRFDDEVTRFLFWRNLIDPYSREWRNGCGRWDLMDLVRAAWSMRPEGIAWPTHPADADPRVAGRPSFRLEHLTAANGLAHEAAHDALSDVRATLALARLLKARQPRLWAHCLKLRKKDAVLAETGLLQGPRPFVHLSGRYPVERGFLAVVWPLGMHPKNKNELIVWDLAEDPSVLATLDAAAVRRRLFTRQDELDAAAPDGVGERRLPIKTVHLNRSPVVVGNLRAIDGVKARWGLDLDAAQRHAERAAALPPLGTLWAEVYAREHAPADVDEDLYGGFVGDADRRTLERLRGLAPEALAGQRPAFADPRLDELLFRYRARNFPHTLSEAEQARWQQHRAARLLQGEGGALTLTRFHERVDALAEAALERDDERAQALLEALLDYAESIAP